MATQIIVRHTGESKSLDPIKKVMRFFGSVAEQFELYLDSPKRLDMLDEEFRNNLTVHERAAIDADLHSIGRY